MKIAAQGYTFRDFTKSKDEIKESFDKVKKIGYTGVQVSAFRCYEPAFLAKTAKERGLEIIATHTPLDRILNDTQAVIDEHLLMGTKYVGLGAFGERSLFAVKGFLQDIVPAAEKLYAAGLQFIYHNHHHEFIKYDGIRAMDYMIERTTPQNFGLLTDLYWLQYAGVNPSTFLKRHIDRINIVHLKDMRVNQDGTPFVAEVFEGNMDYNLIMQDCVDLGIEWGAVEQETCDIDPFVSLEKSFVNLKANGWVK